MKQYKSYNIYVQKKNRKNVVLKKHKKGHNDNEKIMNQRSFGSYKKESSQKNPNNPIITMRAPTLSSLNGELDDYKEKYDLPNSLNK